MRRQTQAPEVRHNPTDPESVLDGVPRTLPALLEALQLTRKAARIGFDWYNLDGIFAKLQEETHELQDVLAKCRRGSLEAIGSRSRPAQAGFSSDNKQTNRKGAGRPGLQPGTRSAPEESASRIEGELGDILFVAVNLARFLNLDPEIALKKASSKFSRRFRAMEQFAREQGTTLAKIARPQMESLWDQAKLHEQSVPQK
jgi:uncharacterized protein YabN with tetrapyrrole methylase and pyrophosphatase domain